MKKRLLESMLGAAAFAVSSGTAAADEFHAPRGPNIKPIAASCGIGPFPQTGKAGPYNSICTELTDAEKCLALIKRNMDAVGVIRPPLGDKERVEFCLETFKAQLLNESQ